MGDMRATMLDHRLLSSRDPLITAHSTHFPLTVLVGYALFWTYIVAAVVVMLNMLIAMMSNSFQEIYVSFTLVDLSLCTCTLLA